MCNPTLTPKPTRKPLPQVTQGAPAYHAMQYVTLEYYGLPMWGLEKEQIARLEAYLESKGGKKKA